MCMGGYSIRLEGLEDPGFCSHLGVRMADGRNGLRATAANTTTTPSGKSPSGRCPRGFRLPRSHRTRMAERVGVSGVLAGWIFRQLSSTATAKQPAQASVVRRAGDTITTSLPLASQMSSRAASAASKASQTIMAALTILTASSTVSDVGPCSKTGRTMQEVLHSRRMAPRQLQSVQGTASSCCQC